MSIINNRTLINEAPLFFTISMVLAAVAAIIHFVFIPYYSRLQTCKAELVHYNSIISSESGYQKLKDEISGKIDTLKVRLAPLPDQKKVSNDPGSYLEMLIAVARKAEIRFSLMQPQEESLTADHIKYPVLLALTSTYHELGQFIAAIEKLPFMFTVDRLAIDAVDNGKCNVRLLVTCLIPKEQHDE
jgi:Tfp pilus assembly protein PilO